MQLHVCLLLFIITSADKTLASSDHHCGGNIILDKKPAGHISLTLPGPYTDTNNQPDANLSLCTWFVDIPVGTTVLFTLAELVGGAGSSVSVHCVGAGEDDEQVLEKGRESLLSGCDGNKATITWTNAGHSSVQLDYYVQEDERNSSEGHTTHHPGLVSWSPTGTGFTRTPPVSQDVVRGKEGVRGRRCEGLEWCHGPRAVSGRSSEDQGPPDPTTPLQRLALGGRTDGETLPLPEEAPNNGADTSGTVRLTDSPISASEATHSYFHTQHTLSTDTSNTSSRETNSSNDLAKTQMALTDAAASNSKAALAADKHKHTDAPTHTHTATQTPATASSFSIPALSSSPPPLPQTTWVGGSILITHGGAVGEEKQPRSWANTNAFGSDLTSVTSDPVNSHTKPLQDDSGDAHTETDASPSRGSTGPRPFTAHTTALHARVPTATAASFHPNTKRADSSESTTSEAVSQTAAVESSDKFDSSTELRTPTTSAQSPTNLQSTESFTHSSFTETSKDTQTATQRHLINAHLSTVSSPPGIATVSDETSVFTDSSSTSAAPDATTASVGGYARRPAATAHEKSSTYSQTSLLPLRSSSSISTASALHTYSTFSPLASTHTRIDYKTRPVPETSTTEYTPSHTQYRPLLPSSATHKQTQTLTPTTHFPHLTHKTSNQKEPEEGDAVWRWFPSSTATHSPPVTSNPPLSSATSQPPKYYTVPDQPAAIKVETIELLLQIILEDSGSAYAAGLEEDAAAWVRPYLQKAPGFSRLLGVWSSGHAVQNLVEFKTSGALQWLSTTGAASLLERTGLAQAVREERSLRSAKIANITLGGQQGEVCDWLLQCPSGYECVPQPGTTNYSCSSLCHFDYCHHHGICTHHPGQLPVCRCLVGDDFWYMGRRCDVRMTRARLVGACLAILFIIVTVISVLAVVAVRRYRAALIQAKVDQTRSSYRRFNHFDELSGRFWLRSWAGSADSLDNPAFTRSDELLHLRALDRPCCYHDDTLSLASTCPSHGTRINTIYPHSSQYAWRGSEVSVGDGVLDSGKASDLSVCSWPVEPIQWTPFPLLQQLSSHRTPAVRASRPRSYCEGMELVDLEKSWTA